MKLLPSSVTPSNYWGADEEDVHYIWRSGTKEWQKTINFKNQSTSAFYEFSDPVKFDYTHLTANDMNNSATYNNVSYYLEYDGGLHGIPSNENADGNHVREFSLKSGDIFNGKAKLDGRELVLKAVGIEKNPQAAAAGSCSGLPLDNLGLTSPSSTPTISVSKTYADRLIYNLTDYLLIEGVIQ
jgi:NADPH-dependent glutamate synthase beta subunit-like oxidoreductase